MTEKTYEDEVRKNTGSSAGSFIAGAVIGGLVGAGASLLVAPQSGEKTRRKIAERVETEVDTVKKDSEKVVKNLRTQANDIIANVQTKLDDVRYQLAENIDETTEDVAKDIKKTNHKVVEPAK